MTGYINPEGISLPAGSDSWDVVNAMRVMAASTRSVVPISTQAAGDAVATAMAADGRPVSDTNPLIAFESDISSLVVKGSSGWTVPRLGPYTTLNPSVNYTGSGTWWAIPIGKNYLITATVIINNTASGSTTFPGGGVSYTNVGIIAPSGITSLTGAGPMASPITFTCFNAGSGANSQIEIYYNPPNGQLMARGTTSTVTWIVNSQINFQLTYMI